MQGYVQRLPDQVVPGPSCMSFLSLRKKKLVNGFINQLYGLESLRRKFMDFQLQLFIIATCQMAMKVWPAFTSCQFCGVH